MTEKQKYLKIPPANELDALSRCEVVRGGYQCVLHKGHATGLCTSGCRFVEPLTCEGEEIIYYVRFAFLLAGYIVVHDLKVNAPTAFHAIVGGMKYLTEENKFDYVFVDASTYESLLETPVMRNPFTDITTESLV